MTVPKSSGTRDGNLRLDKHGRRTGARLAERAPGLADASVEPVVDMVRLTELLRFPLSSLRRHKLLAFSAFVLVFGAATAAALYLPRTYIVQSRILARRSMVLPALGNPRRTVPTESDAPAHLAVEAVMSRESLTGIIDSVKLLDVMPLVLSPIDNLREKARFMLKGPRTRRDQVDLLVKLLEKRMFVLANDEKEGTVAIGLGWRDPATALPIVQSAQQIFLAKRYEQEVSLVSESIRILERYVANANEAIASSMAQLRKLPGVRVETADPRAFTASAQTSARSRAISAEMARLQAAIGSARNAIAQQEATHSQRVTAVQARLSDLESRFGPAHPEVAAAKKALDDASVESPTLLTLRGEEQRLVGQLAEIGASMPTTVDVGAELAMQRLSFERLLRVRSDSLEDPRITYARSQLKIATTNYEDMLDRVEAARIELETARASFKYRYTVISPAQAPRRPDSPNMMLLLVGGAVCAVFAALFSATARDVFGGLVVEKWQVSRHLGLPVLGEITRE